LIARIAVKTVRTVSNRCFAVAGAVARIGKALRRLQFRLAGITVGENVSIGRRVRLTGKVALGDGAKISEGVLIEGCVTIGRGCWIQKLVEISGNVEVGDSTSIGSYSFISTAPNGRMRIGNDVLVNAYSVIGAADRVDIGDHCIFAAYVQITDSAHGIADPDVLTKHSEWRSAPVVICENVWLGSGTMVTMGSSIGAGSVIGAKSLVNSEIPAMSVAYGTPARVKRNRLDAGRAST
jgi:acetyltransferase-like isoleucine patch superfamily enzyme